MFISTGNNEPTALQCGPDGRIYVSANNKKTLLYYLGCIAYPEKPVKDCGFHFFWQSPPFTNFCDFPGFLYNYRLLGFNYSQQCNKIILNQQSDTSFYKNFYWYSANDSASGNTGILHFTRSGKYLVTIKGVSEKGYSAFYTDTVSYIAPPHALFKAERTKGCQWTKLKFINQSAEDSIPGGPMHYLWNFGDGKTDTSASPEHIYVSAGKFNVQLIAFNDYCSDTFLQKEAVEIIPAPRAAFKVNSYSGCAPFSVQVSSLVNKPDIRYFYSFGDGSGDSIANPSHVYTTQGAYLLKQYIHTPEGCVTADSVMITVHPPMPATAISRIRQVSAEDRTLHISWDSIPGTAYYLVERTNASGTDIFNAKAFTTQYSDNGADIGQFSYTYKISASDSCGNLSQESYPVRSILLQGKALNNDRADLQWNSYELYNKISPVYKIERQLNGSFAPIASVKDTFYSDNLFFDPNEADAVYRVKAVIPNEEDAYSNIFTLHYKFILSIPNAFTPDKNSVNDTFRIKTAAGIKTELRIYNRWGELVFQNAANEQPAWDGYYRNSPAEAGVYYYILDAADAQGHSYRKRGTITLLR